MWLIASLPPSRVCIKIREFEEFSPMEGRREREERKFTWWNKNNQERLETKNNIPGFLIQKITGIIPHPENQLMFFFNDISAQIHNRYCVQNPASNLVHSRLWVGAELVMGQTTEWWQTDCVCHTGVRSHMLRGPNMARYPSSNTVRNQSK